MNNITLTSTKNPLIKQVRKLQAAKERKRQNLLLLEGTNLIDAACQVDYKLDTVFYTEYWQENHQILWQTITEKEVKTQPVSTEVLNAIATTVNPDGIVAIASRKQLSEPGVSATKLGIALERLQDPGNLGTIIRTAAATGVDSLWLSEDSVDIYNPKVLRASVGQWFSVPIGIEPDLPQLIRQYQQAGIQIVATASEAAQSYWEVDFTRPTLIVLGNEGAGLSAELMAIADEQVNIPLANGVESLNVAVATALLLYEAKRQLGMSK